MDCQCHGRTLQLHLSRQPGRSAFNGLLCDLDACDTALVYSRFDRRESMGMEPLEPPRRDATVHR